MKVKMKISEKMAIDYANKFKKNWEHFIIASDAYLSGVKDTLEVLSTIPELDKDFLAMLSSLVEVEYKDGEHQIGAKINNKHAKECCDETCSYCDLTYI